ncbi:phage tail protein [Sediminimonas qiaohouensis]|uniref:phage tail-collar fiber domain-containing protein n=1 Tax=Sediminimonas qiaohouensis TaxID=552061 RepID=UPI0004271883|nr:phage tail protein [Sediminimonas qiaohouensis]
MAQFATIHTQAGLQAMSQAEAAGVPINLTDMAVGDGSGSTITPTESQTALVREVYRASINRVYKPDPTGQPTKYAVELVVPASEGGFVMREVGVFDSDGTLFVVGNLPETYKPEASEGSFSDTVVRVEFIATNSDVVTIQADPNVTVATQQWVTNNITAGAILPGGTTGQILRKVSNDTGDIEWADPTDANVIVNVIEEYQTLADGQTIVTLSTVTTTGLAVYIDGIRLREDITADGWQPDGTDAAKLTLGQSYPAGTEIIAVQNEPAAGFPDALLRDSNLADLPDKALGRQNLDVYSRAQTDQRAPPGLIGHFARNTAPAGWLKANGAEVDRTVYAGLFNAIGTTFGAGNGVDTFNLPDLRGEFVRGLDDGRGIDAGRGFGSAQGGRMQDHHHGTGDFRNESEDNWFAIVRGWVGTFTGRWIAGESQRKESATITGGTGGTRYTGTTDQILTAGSETRPRNIALLACIKA